MEKNIDNLSKSKEKVLEELNEKASLLGKNFDRINNWIENNIDTDPNFYEMVSCEVDFGMLVKEYDSYYSENGYPNSKEGEGLSDHYHITFDVDELWNVREKLEHMYKLRNTHPIFEEECVKKFFTELHFRSCVAEYLVSEDKENVEINKEVLCRVAGVYLYIWQETKKDPEYRYDNVSEFQALKFGIDIIKEDNSCRLYYNNGMIDAINENYIYNTKSELHTMNI